MNNKLNEIDIKIIKFLISGAAYSDLAIVKNLGITYDELENSYNTLLKNGYLETYEDYQKREEIDSKNCCKSSCSSSIVNKSCNCSCKSSGGGCCKTQTDNSNIKVLTWKAIIEFDN